MTTARNNDCRTSLVLHCRVRYPPIAHSMNENGSRRCPAAGAASFDIQGQIDLIMRSHLSKQTLSDEQKEFGYADLSTLINDLRSSKTIPGPRL
jgi:hypothetical protein